MFPNTQNELLNLFSLRIDNNIDNIYREDNEANNRLLKIKANEIRRSNSTLVCLNIEKDHESCNNSYLKEIVNNIGINNSSESDENYKTSIANLNVVKKNKYNSKYYFLKIQQDLFLSYYNINTEFKQNYCISLIEKTNLINRLSIINSHPTLSFLNKILKSIYKSNSLEYVNLSGIDFDYFYKDENKDYNNLNSNNNIYCIENINRTNLFINFCWIKELVLENCNLNDELIILSFNSIYDNSNLNLLLEKINLNSNNLTNKAIESIVKCVESRCFKRLKCLKLANNKITNLDFILNLLGLETLNCYNNPIDSEGANSLINLLKKESCSLKNINIGKLYLNEKFIINMSKAIEENIINNKLENVILNKSLLGNHIVGSMNNKITKNVESNNKSNKMASNNLNDYCINYLSDILFNLNNVYLIDFSYLNLKNLNEFCQSLRFCDSIKTINLSNNNFHNKVLVNILNSLCFTNVRRINLSNNYFDSIEAETLNNFLKNNNNLIEINLSENLFLYKDLLMICSFIKYNSKYNIIEYFDLTNQKLNCYNIANSNKLNYGKSVINDSFYYNSINNSSKNVEKLVINNNNFVNSVFLLDEDNNLTKDFVILNNIISNIFNRNNFHVCVNI